MDWETHVLYVLLVAPLAFLQHELVKPQELGGRWSNGEAAFAGVAAGFYLLAAIWLWPQANLVGWLNTGLAVPFLQLGSAVAGGLLLTYAFYQGLSPRVARLSLAGTLGTAIAWLGIVCTWLATGN